MNYGKLAGSRQELYEENKMLQAFIRFMLVSERLENQLALLERILR